MFTFLRRRASARARSRQSRPLEVECLEKRDVPSAAALEFRFRSVVKPVVASGGRTAPTGTVMLPNCPFVFTAPVTGSSVVHP